MQDEDEAEAEGDSPDKSQGNGPRKTKDKKDKKSEQDDASSDEDPGARRYFDLEAAIAKASRLGQMDVAGFKDNLQKAIEAAQATRKDVQKLPDWAQKLLNREVQILENRTGAVRELLTRSTNHFKEWRLLMKGK